MPQYSAQLELFPACLHLERVEPKRNMRRFYRMTIEKNLISRHVVGCLNEELIDSLADVRRRLGL